MRTLALAGIISPSLLTVLVILQGLLIPAYSHVGMPISALAAWPAGWIQNLNFWIAGTLIIAFVVALNTGVQSTGRCRLGMPLLILSGVGLLGCGVFPWTMVNGAPTETPPHVAAAISTFAATGFGFVAFARRMSADPQWSDLSTYTLSPGMAILLLFAAGRRSCCRRARSVGRYCVPGYARSRRSLGRTQATDRPQRW